MKVNKFLLMLIAGVFVQCTSNDMKKEISKKSNLEINSISIPSLVVNRENTHEIVKAYRIAIGDIS